MFSVKGLTSLIAFTLAVAALPACARKENRTTPRYTAVNEAYELLDKGQTSRALALLETIVQEEPANTEARVMLASAYMGKAGIDVLSMHDAFKDVLFSRSLSDVFFKGGKSQDAAPTPGSTTSDPLTGAPPVADSEAENAPTPAEALFERVDEFLNNVRRVLVVLDRFPRVQPTQWPMVDQALYNLNQTPLHREIRLYRMFIRMIYLKEVLVTRILRDPNFATRKWACTLELAQLHESLSWVSIALAEISEDFIKLYPKDGSPFTRVEALFKVFSEKLGNLEASTPAGGETAMMMSQRRINKSFGCPAYMAVKK